MRLGQVGKTLARVLATASLCVIGAAATARAQGTIVGHVVAEGTNAPLADAQVIVVGSQSTAQTSQDGRYTLNGVRNGTVDVQVIHVGYSSTKKSVTVTSGQTSTLDFTMSVLTIKLQDVVTTATGQQRKIELGNSVATLGDVSSRVQQTEVSNINDLLIAKVPGLIVLPGNAVGAASTFRIRGVSSISLSNAPIFYVDGVRYNAGNVTSAGQQPITFLNNLDPDEIEDIEIVKGPSAATLYGTNAANGVIVITTKKGRAGNTRWTWTAESRTIDDRNHYQPQFANWGHSPTNPGTQIRCELPTMNIASSLCVSDSLTSYNILGDPASTFIMLGRGSLYGVNMSGGNEAVRFFASGDLDNEFGTIQMPQWGIDYFNQQHMTLSNAEFHPRSQQRSNFRANVSASLSPKFDLNLTSGFSKTSNALEPDNSLIISLLYVGQSSEGHKGPGLGMQITDPTTGAPFHGFFSFSPADIMQYIVTSDIQRYTGSANATWRPYSWMQNEGTVGVDLLSDDIFHVCHLSECPQSGATSRVGNVSDQRLGQRNFSAKASSTGTWQARTWANLKTSVGTDYTNIESDQTSAGGRGLAPGASTVGSTTTPVTWSYTQPQAVKTLGLYGQEQIGFNDRMFLTFAERTDQNSAFGSKFQRVYYPKVSLSWLLSEESRFPHWSWLNQFRLRAAYGANGVQPGATAALQTFSAGAASLVTRGTINGTDISSLSANQPGNSALKPETSGESEFGFDSDILNRRLHIEYTFYNKKTKDALISVPIAASAAAPITSLLENVGSTQNYGHEFQANAVLVDSRRLGWDVTFSASHNTNKWVNLGIDPATGKERIIGAGGTTEQRQGASLNEQWYRNYTYKDLNGDGIITANEVTVDTALVSHGYNAPRDLVSIQNGFDLFQHRLRINTLFDYKGGGNAVDGTNNFQCSSAPLACRENEDPTSPLWMQARSVAKIYGTLVNNTFQKTALGYYQSDQFWRWRELSAVITIPNKVTTYVRAASGSSITLGVRNLHYWTRWTGIDPEANYGLTGAENQNEFNTSPQPTYFTMRLNLKY